MARGDFICTNCGTVEPAACCCANQNVIEVGDLCRMHDELHRVRYEYEELVERVQNWLKESPMSERIGASRCRALLEICAEHNFKTAPKTPETTDG